MAAPVTPDEPAARRMVETAFGPVEVPTAIRRVAFLTTIGIDLAVRYGF
ncbi:MAG: hypothetical protein ACT4OM_13945 [Actinomycetota bacterium]